MLSAPSTRVFSGAFTTVVVVGLTLEGNKPRAHLTQTQREKQKSTRAEKYFWSDALYLCVCVCESERELFRCLLSKGYTFFIKAVRCGYKSALYPQQEIYKRSVG
jgi:hypothetical protein